MLISEIKKTSPGRLTVVFEDESEIKSTLNVVSDLRLFSGKDMDEEQINELRSLSSRCIAREKALEYISRRRMSCREIEKKMLDKGYDEETAAYCVDWLLQNGFLNDESYAGAVVRHYAAKGYGPGRIRSELSRRGIDRELWDGAFEEMPEDTSKIDKFIASRLTDPSDRAQVQKVTAALYRRGHSWEDIRRALRCFSADCEE